MQANIWKLKVMRGVVSFSVVMSFITIFWLSKGLSMQEIFIAKSVFGLIILLLEIPSGYFADKYGRRASLIVAAILLFLAYLQYNFVDSFFTVLLAEISMGAAVSFYSGAESALLYDSLKEIKQEQNYHQIESDIFSLTGYSEAIAALLGGYLASKNMELAFAFQTVLYFLIIPINFSFQEPKSHEKASGESLKEIIQVSKYSLIEHKEIKWIILLSGFTASASYAIIWFSQAHWEYLKIPLVYFGLLWASINFIRALVSKYSAKFTQKFGKKNTLILLSLSPLIYFGLALTSKNLISIAIMSLFWMQFAIQAPTIKQYLNELSESKYRATILSVKSMVQKLIFSAISPFLGYTLDLYSYQTAFLASGIIFTATSLISLIYLKKYKII